MKRLWWGLVIVFVSGCRLNDLLNPGPPPKEEMCERVWKLRIIQNDGADTTYITRRQVVPCEEEP